MDYSLTIYGPTDDTTHSEKKNLTEAQYKSPYSLHPVSHPSTVAPLFRRLYSKENPCTDAAPVRVIYPGYRAPLITAQNPWI
jgi:hypothetical protein